MNKTSKETLEQLLSRMQTAEQKELRVILKADVQGSLEAVAASMEKLSGPKVNSFMLNLIGVVDEVTNDAWMANYANVDQNLFKGAGSKATKSSGYIAPDFIQARLVNSGSADVGAKPVDGE